MFTSHGVPVQFSKSDYRLPHHSDLIILAQLMWLVKLFLTLVLTTCAIFYAPLTSELNYNIMTPEKQLLLFKRNHDRAILNAFTVISFPYSKYFTFKDMYA
jgi:hypothetical protein